MKPRITKEEAQDFKRRWDEVRSAEREELRSTPVAIKFRQLAALMVSVEQMGWTEALRAEEDEVRKRWMKLRRAYLA